MSNLEDDTANNVGSQCAVQKELADQTFDVVQEGCQKKICLSWMKIKYKRQWLLEELYPERLAAMRVDPWYLSKIKRMHENTKQNIDKFMRENHQLRNPLTILLEQ